MSKEINKITTPPSKLTMLILVNSEIDLHQLGKLRKWSQWQPNQHDINKKKKLKLVEGGDEVIKKKRRGGKKQRDKRLSLEDCVVEEQ
jgi:hypothetical protein